MELTKQQKTGMVVAALAVAALGVDRFVLGASGPATASAQVAGPVVGMAEIDSARFTLDSKPTNTFAQQLERFAARHNIEPQDGVPDAFGVEVEAEEQVWKVSAVIGNGKRGAVKIGDKIIPVGTDHEGAVLLRVDSEGGIFSKGGREFRALIDRPVPRSGR